MAVPKSKTSKMRSRIRRRAKAWKPPVLVECKECGSRIPSHICCPVCGYYKGKKYLNVD